MVEGVAANQFLRREGPPSDVTTRNSHLSVAGIHADALPSLALSSALLAMPEDALAAEKPSFNRGPDGRTPFGVPLYRSRMYAAQ